MKKIRLMLLVACVGASASVSAADGPTLAPMPVPEYRTPLPTELPVLPRATVVRSTSRIVGEPLPLFENVKVEDRHNIHPFAVKEIVRVKDPRPDCHLCGSPGFVFIEICVPPHCKPEIDIKRKDGSKIEYDYGDYEVEITSKNGYVKVDYDD